jgi:lipopolysaccharide biosynthesis regulator YciM
MDNDHSNLDHLKGAYKVAVEAWLTAIRQEEDFVSAAVRSVEDLDKWEAAHFHEDELRATVKTAKKEYEGALRKTFYNF